MFRKIIGVFTAIAAAVLVVGVAWASGDGSEESSNTVAASSDLSGSVSVTGATSPTTGDSTPTSAAGATTPTVDDNSTSSTVDSNTRTSVSVVDTSSTSTSVGASTSTSSGATSTSVGSSSTSATVDDRPTVPTTTDPTSHDVNGAGTVTVQVVSGQLVLIDASAASGWSMEVDKADSRDIRVEFESGDSDARFEAKIRDGELRVKIERN